MGCRDGEGVQYTYEALGRRSTATRFNAQNRGLHVTTYEHKGNNWNVVRERNKDGEVKAGYTYDLEGRVREGFGTGRAITGRTC